MKSYLFGKFKFKFRFKCSAFECFYCPEGITPNSGLIGPNNTYIYIYIYIRSSAKKFEGDYFST